MLPRLVSISAIVFFIFGPAAVFALDYDDAVHLLERTGFGAPPRTIVVLSALSRAEAVDFMINGLRTDPAVTPPPWSIPPFPKPPGDRAHPADAATKKAYAQMIEDHKQELRAWYINGLVSAPSPLTEKMVLFWHNHFTSSLEKTNSPELLLGQDLLLRRLGTTSFGALLHAVSRDPAMVLYLDNETNVKGKPNENYARELLELFTMGEGNYSEQDVKEAARAFTGLTVDRYNGTTSFDPHRHDDGTKTFLGKTGNFNGDDIVDIILQQDRPAVFLTEKLWQYFISPQPDPALIQTWAAAFRSSGYQITTLLRLMLGSDAFWAEENRNALIKSPVELLIGFIRTWGITDYDPKRLTYQLSRLGQDLFNPISVKGWPWGRDWIDAATLLERRRDIADLVNSFRRQSQLAAANLE
ncbi:MAG: DUF1800 domain-containing protein [Spirochaetia bacterium]|jgi:uncharacterized protein (DUF1800 family)